MSEVKAIEAIDNALSSLEKGEQTRVLAWAHMKYGTPAPLASAPAASSGVAPAAASASAPATTKAKSSKKSKTIISMDKTLNLSPSGKPSAVEFASIKSPKNVMQKCVVATYYIRENIEIPFVTAQAVFTFFKTLSWPVPADLKNTLQQAGTMGWLDTADSENIKVTSLGENLVEHELPAKAKS